MTKPAGIRWWLWLAVWPALASAPPAVAATPPEPAHKALVVVIPVKQEIAAPQFYVIRRGLKEAIERHADAVVLDLDTPGGDMGTMQDIFAALEKFPGLTIAYVDDEAASAGALVAAATDEIWFAPTGVIGAAAPVSETGADIGATMKEKVVSYMKARMRALTAGRGHRAEVVQAMIDSDYVLTVDGHELKGKGSLLSLTAAEAMKRYGQPPEPLLGAGIAKNVDDLLAQKFGAGNFTVLSLRVTWSETMARWLNLLSPVLLGLGLLALYIEFKTPGFGFFGVAGIVLLGLVFLGHFVAGFSGHEPLVVFALGLVLLILEMLFFHSAGLLGVVGLALMLGSLVWAMADIWPGQPAQFSGALFWAPLLNLGLGLVFASALAAALARFLPKSFFWDRLVLHTAVESAAQSAGAAPAADVAALVGRRGVAATPLRPAGQVEIGGRRYEARLAFGVAEAGEPVVVTGRTDFGLVVERAPA